jgi:lipopolysaccharide/colanic/teichoic acid biosynthesis glycosyltransferase
MGGYFRHRDRAKPGITGLWQTSGRSDLGFREMVLLDLYYIEHQTILFDLEILLQTIPAVLFGKGAY